jgi:hypothetical protein
MANSAKKASPNFAKPVQEKIGLNLNMSSTSLDKAAVYLHSHYEVPKQVSVDTRTLVRKIDWRIIPLAFMCYAVQFIDKININVCIFVVTLCGIILTMVFGISMQLSWG